MGKVDKLHGRTPSRPPDASLDKVEDRRIRGHRLDVSFPVLATHNGHPIQGYIEAINLSWSGMLLATNFPLDVNDKIELEFTLPQREVPLRVQGKVVHSSDGSRPEEATLLGIAFENVDPNTRKILAGFVLENLSTE